MAKIKNQFELSRLKNMVSDNVIKDHTLSQGFKNNGMIQSAADMAANAVQPVISGSEWAQKIASKTGAAGKVARALASSPVAKKAALVLGGPAAMALGTAQDAMASEDLGRGSDQVDHLQNEDALMNLPPEGFNDPQVSDQARRWQKIRGLMGN